MTAPTRSADAYSKAADVGVRRASVPYKDAAEHVDVRVNDEARRAITDASAQRFVHIFHPNDAKLVALLAIMERGWDKVGVKAKNAGHHSLWPEAFAAGRALLESAFPDECDPRFGGQVLDGVAFVNEPDKLDRAIDFMQRRPKGDFTMCKYNPLGRLHRDPDAVDYKSPDWMRTAMPEKDVYAYRYYNIWLARSPIDPTGQVWENPLVMLLPRNGGAKEWRYDVRKPEDNDVGGGGGDNNAAMMMDKLKKVVANPMMAGPMVMNAFSARNKMDAYVATDPDYMTRGSPELCSSNEHVFVAAPFVAFEAFDVWHGAGTWDREAKTALAEQCLDKHRARQELVKGRVSMELRFRARYKPTAGASGASGDGVPWSPVSAAYRGGAFTPTRVRPSEGEYDLIRGTTREVTTLT